jgi:hypothetical protein
VTQPIDWGQKKIKVYFLREVIFINHCLYIV